MTERALLAAALVLNPREGGLAYVLGLCGSFKWTLLMDLQFLLPPQPPLVFIARSYEALFPNDGTLGCALWPETGWLTPQMSLPVFICPG